MKYRNIDFVIRYAESLGMRLLKGKEVDTIDPLNPFIIMDVAYSIYRKNIQPLAVRHELKKYKKLWIDSYTKFNQRLFRAFNDEMQDQFIEKLDDFESTIANDITIAEVACMNCFPMVTSLEDQKILSATLICHMLAHISLHEYASFYVDGKRHIEPQELKDICRATTVFARLYMDEKLGKVHQEVASEQQTTNLANAVQALKNKILRWIEEDDKKSALIQK